jgi:ADP-glucose pyrophosphorylase
LPASVELAPGARVVDSIVWDDVTVGAGAVVERCIVTDGVAIAAGAHYRGSMLIQGPDGLNVIPLPEECR